MEQGAERKSDHTSDKRQDQIFLQDVFRRLSWIKAENLHSGNLSASLRQIDVCQIENNNKGKGIGEQRNQPDDIVQAGHRAVNGISCDGKLRYTCNIRKCHDILRKLLLVAAVGEDQSGIGFKGAKGLFTGLVRQHNEIVYIAGENTADLHRKLLMILVFHFQRIADRKAKALCDFLTDDGFSLARQPDFIGVGAGGLVEIPERRQVLQVFRSEEIDVLHGADVDIFRENRERLLDAIQFGKL